MKDFLGELEKLCGDNYIWVLISCAVLLLIIIAALCKAFAGKSKRNPDPEEKGENREFFLEGEYDRLLRQKALSKAAPHDGEMLVPEENAEMNKPETATEENENEGTPDKAVPAANGDDAESMQPLQININIQRGQVKIGYSTGEAMSYRMGMEDGHADVKEPEVPEGFETQENYETLEQSRHQDNYEAPEHFETQQKPEEPEKTQTMEIFEAPETPEAFEEPEALNALSETGEKPSGREIIMEKINIVKGTPARKFGPDNMNTARSGRVYTEEELRRLIK